MKNLSQWKTTLIGIVSFAVAFFYLFKVEEINVWIFSVLLVFGTMMLFSADTLISSIRSFLRANKDTKIKD